jgi:hypothetical protein
MSMVQVFQFQILSQKKMQYFKFQFLSFVDVFLKISHSIKFFLVLCNDAKSYILIKLLLKIALDF